MSLWNCGATTGKGGTRMKKQILVKSKKESKKKLFCHTRNKLTVKDTVNVDVYQKEIFVCAKNCEILPKQESRNIKLHDLWMNFK